MPLYEFRCKECSGEFKKLVRSTALSEVQCPSCHTTKVMRLLSVTARTSEGEDFASDCCLPMGGG